MSHRHRQPLTWSNDDYRQLQRELDRMRKLKEKWHKRAKQHEAALREIAEGPPKKTFLNGVPIPEHRWERIAREALETKDD